MILGDPAHLTAFMEMYSTSLFEATVARAHLSCSTPIPDVDGIDRHINFKAFVLNVQVKATYAKRFNKAGELQFPVEQKWVDCWHACAYPPRLVVYFLPKNPVSWIQVNQQSETHRTHAYWATLDRGVSVPSVTISRERRFTTATLKEWRDELFAGMGGEG